MVDAARYTASNKPYIHSSMMHDASSFSSHVPVQILMPFSATFVTCFISSKRQSNYYEYHDCKHAIPLVLALVIVS